jgi:hypothetical protein
MFASAAVISGGTGTAAGAPAVTVPDAAATA